MEQLSGLLARRRAAAARGSGSAQARPRTSSSRGGSGGAAPTAVGVVAVVAGLVGLSLLVETLTAPDSTLGPAAVELFAKLDEACERRGLLGVVYFSAAYVVATLLLAPASMLVILAGAIYGPALGSAVAVVATIVGSGAAFLVARYLARPSVARRMNAYPRFAAVDRAVAMEGGRMVLLMRYAVAHCSARGKLDHTEHSPLKRRPRARVCADALPYAQTLALHTLQRGQLYVRPDGR